MTPRQSVAALWILFLLPVFFSPASGAAESDRILGERIAGGVTFGGRLWLRGTMGKNSKGDRTGGLVSFDLQNYSRRTEFEADVLDVKKSETDLWALRRRPNTNEFVISTWQKDSFQDLAEFKSSDKDEPIALVNSAGLPVVLAVRSIRIFEIGTHTWRVLALKGERVRSGIQVAAAAPRGGGSVYVGFNMGEWGGGLQRIDLQSGIVTNIERRDTKALCDGPLNSDCDPVTGVIPDPQDKDCVLASVGLVHLGLSNGRILRICGQRVTLVSEVLISKTKDESWKRTEAVYGLEPAADGGFWAITWRALYYFGASGNKENDYPLPKLKPVSGIYLSRDLPGTIILRTDVNWAVSTSGYTPLVIPLERSER